MTGVILDQALGTILLIDDDGGWRTQAETTFDSGDCVWRLLSLSRALGYKFYICVRIDNIWID